MKLGRRPSFKGQVRCSNIRVQKQLWFVFKNEAGPQAELQDDKSSGPTSKSQNNNELLLNMKLDLDKSNDHNALLRMKLGRRSSFKRTGSMLQRPSPETITICY